MKILLCGSDGYIGWPLFQRLQARGHHVIGIDDYSRRSLVRRVGGCSAIPIAEASERNSADMRTLVIDIARAPRTLHSVLQEQPLDAIVDLAEQPSAAWSMRGVDEALQTNLNNTQGTLSLLWGMREHCPDAHLIKLGTMGEYGTPNIEITEGPLPVEFRGRSDTLPFPRQPGSFYHGTKCADSLYVQQACRFWSLRSTDVMQGIVYGSRGEEGRPTRLQRTRVDFDECFGTVVHRFCAQAVARHPLTIYGSGEQTRSYLPLRDSLTCLTLAIENPPEAGEYRVFNQFDRTYSVMEIAKAVQQQLGSAEISHIDNPRVEAEQHFYKPEAKALHALGYRPTGSLSSDIQQILEDMRPHAANIRQALRAPQIYWRR
jgi:nucleoside-diphosphate-sugar epimerase